MKQLFKKLNINRFKASDIEASLLEDIEKSDVNLTFRWTSNRHILFYKLHLTAEGKTVNILKSSIEASNGGYTFFIGSFENGVDIEISYGFFAITAVPKIISLLTQNNPEVGFQTSPKDPGTTNKIDSGNRLEETIKYKIQ
ncbi:MAG: hypothetical protein Q7T20_01815 [Saprospiraceae bacterium]|nr:hypothetical protein [Saprospiraceae bacterium]